MITRELNSTKVEFTYEGGGGGGIMKQLDWDWKISKEYWGLN